MTTTQGAHTSLWEFSPLFYFSLGEEHLRGDITVLAIVWISLEVRHFKNFENSFK